MSDTEDSADGCFRCGGVPTGMAMNAADCVFRAACGACMALPEVRALFGEGLEFELFQPFRPPELPEYKSGPREDGNPRSPPA